MERQVADLIEKQGAGVGQLKPSFAACDGAGERTFFMTEEFRFEQGLGQRGAIDAHQRPRGARTGVVNRFGNKLLTRAAFAANQDGCFAGCDTVHQRNDFHHPTAVTYDPLNAVAGFKLFAQGTIFIVKPVSFHDALDFLSELVKIERLGQIVGSAVSHCLHGGFDVAVGGHDDNLDFRIDRPHSFEQVKPGKIGHALISKDQLHRLPTKDFQSLFAAACGKHLVALFLEVAAHQLALARFVVDDEYADGIVHLNSRLPIGSQTRKQEPRPGWLSTVILPPWACAIRRAIANPRPEPLALVVK